MLRSRSGPLPDRGCDGAETVSKETGLRPELLSILFPAIGPRLMSYKDGSSVFVCFHLLMGELTRTVRPNAIAVPSIRHWLPIVGAAYGCGASPPTSYE